MATFTVDTFQDETADDGRLSLREAVARANGAPGADAIVFSAGVEGQTLVLEGGQLRVTDDLRVDGNRDGNRSEVTIDAGGGSRVLMVGGDATSLRLEDLTVSGGRIAPGAADPNGGGVLLAAGNDLTLTGCTVEDNIVGGFLPSGGDYQGGGGIYAGADSRVTIVDSLLQDNQALGLGGAVFAASGASIVVRDSELTSNNTYDGGAAIALDGARSLTLTGSTIGYNATDGRGVGGGGILLLDSTATIAGSTLVGNSTFSFGNGGGINVIGSDVALTDTTIAANQSDRGAGVYSRAGSTVVLTGCTVTGNGSRYTDFGAIASGGRLEVENSIVAGNFGTYSYSPYAASDLVGAITSSNGHNIFGSDVLGNVPGDLENIGPARLFAALDADTGGGRLGLNGGPIATVRLRDALNNPALSGADPLSAGDTDQRGVDRPLPPISNPDLGSFELDQRQVSRSPSANNDVLTGTGGADTVAALPGNDLVRGLGGNDTLRGLTGSDTLDGGLGADLLNGGSASDLLRGGKGGDLLRGGAHRDTLFGGGGADRFDFDPGDSGIGANRRDLVVDFARGTDRIDVAAIDAVAGGADDAFAFVGRQAFTAAGQIRFARVGDDTIIQGSTDADRAAEFEIELAGAPTLGAGDFVL